MKKQHYQVKPETLDNIKKEMRQVLYKYFYKTNTALDEILRVWLKSKQPLLDILSKHPNWNHDKLMVQFDTDYSREFNTGAITEFKGYLIDKAIKKRNVKYTYQLPTDEHEALSFLSGIKTQFFEEDDYIVNKINNLNRYNDEFKLRPNMKSSKAIGKICNVLKFNEFENYNREYAKLCDALNPIKVIRHTCISLNPVDFLLMSNGNSWTSCHGINYGKRGEGCYSSGTMSYMLDPVSFIFYTVDASFNGTDIEFEEKVQRQIFGYKDYVLLQSRLYPQKMDINGRDVYKDIREVVQKIISDCLEIPNLWLKTNNHRISKYVKKGSKSTAYPDFRYFDNICSVSIHKSIEEQKDHLKAFSIGRQPICVRCGERHARANSLYCRKCY